MFLDPHERDAIEHRIAELDASLERLASNPSIMQRLTKSVALQFEMGELLRKISSTKAPDQPVIAT